MAHIQKHDVIQPATGHLGSAIAGAAVEYMKKQWMSQQTVKSAGEAEKPKRETVDREGIHAKLDKSRKAKAWINPDYEDYEIKAGDTLDAIAQKNRVSREDLLKANPHIIDPNKIIAGDKIKIPPSTKPAPVGGNIGGIASKKPENNEESYSTPPKPDTTSSSKPSGSCPGDGAGVCGGEANQQGKDLSYEEFKNNKLKDAKWKSYEQSIKDGTNPTGLFDEPIYFSEYNLHDDILIDDYLKKAYANHQKHGDFSVSPKGLILHVLGAAIKDCKNNIGDTIGDTIKDFKNEYPKTTTVVKNTVDGLEAILNYVIEPVLAANAKFNDAFYNVFIGREAKEAMYQKENEFWDAVGKKYDSSLTAE